MPTYDLYNRMLEVSAPIWKDKLRAAAGDPGTYALSAHQIAQVTAAVVHPDHRKKS
jgi:hypothetical protein